MAFWAGQDDPTPGSSGSQSALDILKSPLIGLANQLAQPASYAQYQAETAPDQTQGPGSSEFQTAQGTSEFFHGLARMLRASKTPAGYDTDVNPADHPVGSTISGLGELLPVLGAFAAAPEGAPIEAAGGAALQAGSLVDHVISSTNDMDDGQLAQASPVFKSYLDQGMDPYQARAKLHRDMISSPDMAMSLLTGALAGGVGGRLLRGAGADSSIFGDGLVSRVVGGGVTGGVEGGLAGAAMTGQGEYAQQDADVIAGLRPDIDYAGILSDAASSGVEFGALGAGLGAVHGAFRNPAVERPGSGKSPVNEVNVIGPDADQGAALKPPTAEVTPPVQEATPQETPNAQPAQPTAPVPVAPVPEAAPVAGAGEAEIPTSPEVAQPAPAPVATPVEEAAASPEPAGEPTPPEPVAAAPTPEVPDLTPHDIAAAHTAMPTPEQAESGDYSQGRAMWEGLPTIIETPKGAQRVGTDGSYISPPLTSHYGFIEGVKGVDGDQLDLFMGPNPKSKQVFVVDQIDPKTGKFDEHKVLAGFGSKDKALASYEASFSDGSGPQREGAVTSMPIKQFKEWIKSGEVADPLGYKEPEEVAPKPTKPTAEAAVQAGRVLKDMTEAPAPKEKVANPDKGARDAQAKREKRAAAAQSDADKVREVMKAQIPDHFQAADTKAERAHLLGRLDRIAAGIKEAGVKIKTRVGHEVTPNEIVYARDAADMAEVLRKRADANKIDKPTQDRITQFLLDELYAHHDNDYTHLRSRRAQAGEEFGAKQRSSDIAEGIGKNDEGQASAEERIADTAQNPEEVLAERQEAENGEGNNEDLGAMFTDVPPEGNERPSVEIPPDAVTAGKSATGSGVQVEVRRSGRKLQKLSLSERPNELQAKSGEPTGASSRDEINALGKDRIDPTKIDPSLIHKVTTLDKLVPARKGNTRLSSLNEAIFRRLTALAGHVPVYIVDHDAVQHMTEPFRGNSTVPGFYDHSRGNMVLSSLEMGKDGTVDAHTLIHEALHAAFYNALERTPELRAKIENLRQFVKDNYGDQLKRGGMDYGLTDVHEFVSEALSNQGFQEFLTSIKLPADLRSQFTDFGGATNAWDAFWKAAAKWVMDVAQHWGMAKDAMSSLEAMVRTGGELEANVRQFNDKALHEALFADAPTINMLRKSAVSNPEENAKNIEGLFSRIQDKAMSAAKVLDNRGANIRRGLWNLVSNDQMRQEYGKYFPGDTYSNHNNLVAESAGYADELMKPGKQLTKELIEAQAKDPQGFANLANLLNDSRIFSADPSKPLTAPENAHLADVSYAQGRAKHPELEAEYKALPEPMQEMFDKTVDYFKQDQGSYRSHWIDYALGDTKLANDAGLKSRILDGTLDDADRKALGKELGEQEAEGITDLMQSPKGPYTPLSRRGDFVVQGKYNVEAPEGGRVLRPNTYEFTDAAKRDAFVKDLPVHADVRETYYDPNDGHRLTAEDLPKYDDKKVYPHGVDTRWVVHYDPRHIEFKDSQHDAEELVKELRANPDFESVNGVERRHEFQLDELTSRQADLISKKLGEGKSKSAQASIKENIKDLYIEMLRGNRIQKRNLNADKIAGASRDLNRNVLEYTTASARGQARLKYEPELEKNLKVMRDHVRATQDGGTLLRSDLVQDLEKRTSANYSVEPPNTFSRIMGRVMTLSFMKNMASPAHLLIHMSHPGMLSLPILGARHGWAKASVELARAYKDMRMLGALGEAGKGAVRMAKSATAEPTSYLNYFRSKLSNVSDASRLGRMLQTLADRQIIHADAGMEVQRMMPEGGKVGRMLGRADGAFRELTNATESINRVAEAIAAYRLEFAKTGSHDAAVRYAQNTLANTQGWFTRSNTAPIFKNRYLRPFLQFKQYPQMIYHLLGRNIVDTFKGESKEVRIEAAKSFAGVLATHMVMAGALGLPLELGKIGVLVAHALGLTNTTWQDLEDGAQEKLGNEFGGYFGQILAHGILRGLGPLSVDVHHRLGLNSMLTFGEPDSSKPDDTRLWLYDTLAGAPASFASDMVGGVQDMLNGNFAKGAAQIIPVKAVDDVLRAYTLATQGKPTGKGMEGAPPQGVGPTVVQALGFKPGGIAQYDEARNAAYSQNKETRDEKTALIQAWAGAPASGKTKATAAVTAYNKGKPAAEQIKMSTLVKAGQALKGKTMLGVPVTTKNRDQLQGLKENFNVQ